MNPTHLQSIVKAVTWRGIATSITMGVTYSVTGRIDTMASIGVVDVALKMAAYFLHERAWSQRYFHHVAGCLSKGLLALCLASSLVLRKLME